ncbi:MAG: 4a-hydroxytetrahydrobiopterin dehydratase [Polyangiales bacterium]
MAARLLSVGELEAGLKTLPGWRVEDGKLRRELRFPSFVEAFGFLTSLAIVAERLNHHPEIFNVYNRVDLTLWTHDSNGLTELDLGLAQAANKLAGHAESSEKS